MEASAAKTGSTTAPAHTLYEIVRKLPDGAQVELETASDGNSLAIRAGRSRFTLQCLPPADFPAMNEGDLPHRFQLPATDLKGIIDRTRFAISNEETRYYLNGIYFHAAKSGGTEVLRGVATDGHRLARVEVPLPKGAGEIPGVIVPRKTVGEVRKLLDESDGSVDIELSDTRIRFATRQRHPGQQADRRHLPGLRAGHPDRQRQGPERAVQGVRPRRRPRLDHLHREVARHQARGRQGRGHALGHQPRRRQRHRGDRGRLQGDRRSRSASTRATCSTSPSRSTGAEARFLMADAGSPTLVRDGADESALYVLMPMRV